MPPFAQSPWVLTLLGVAMLATGTVSAYQLTVAPAREAREARAWRETRCHVIRSAVTVDRRGKHNSYDAEIAYEYEVGGRHYVGSRVALTSSSGDRGDAEDTAARYPLGWDTTCWYDPADPSSATLSRTIPESFWPALHLLFLFGGVGMLAFRRSAYHPEVSGAPVLIGIAWSAAVIGAIAYLAFDLGHTATGAIASAVAVATVGWFAHALRVARRS